MNLFIIYELVTLSGDLNTDFTLGDCLFGALKSTNNYDPGKYRYRDYGIGFDARSILSLPNGEW